MQHRCHSADQLASSPDFNRSIIGAKGFTLSSAGPPRSTRRPALVTHSL